MTKLLLYHLSNVDEMAGLSIEEIDTAVGGNQPEVAMGGVLHEGDAVGSEHLLLARLVAESMKLITIIEGYAVPCRELEEPIAILHAP